MVKLKDIDAALAERNYVEADYLTRKWYKDRGIIFQGDCPDGVINYIERLEEQVKPSTWTTTKPSKPGWYWYKPLSIATPSIVVFVYTGHDGLWGDMGYGQLDPINKVEGEWSSAPIAEPKEAS